MSDIVDVESESLQSGHCIYKKVFGGDATVKINWATGVNEYYLGMKKYNITYGRDALRKSALSYFRSLFK